MTHGKRAFAKTTDFVPFVPVLPITLTMSEGNFNLTVVLMVMWLLKSAFQRKQEICRYWKLCERLRQRQDTIQYMKHI